MFNLMRNVHLILGLVSFVFAMIFAVSSMVIIYRPWLNQAPQDSERTVRVAAAQAPTPRALALELMRSHGLDGDLRQVQQTGDEMSFVIFRPGTRAQVQYSTATGEAKIQTRTHGLTEALVQLHVNHGFWHEFMQANIWALLSLMGSIGLLLLGASGIYLWFCHHEERLIGSIILVIGLLYSLTTLVLSRTA